MEIFKRKKKTVQQPKAFEGEYVLDVEDLKIRYETDDAVVYAVNGIDLKLKRKQTLGLVGETGAGKTSTVLALLKLIPTPPGVVEAKKILVNGKDVMALSDKQLQQIRGNEIAMVFQDPMTSLDPVYTVGEQIAESYMIHDKLSKKEALEEAKKMLEIVGIPAERSGEFPYQFSGGMKQRVVIAIALACRPNILIADEPTTALDVTIQLQVLELMKQLNEKYQTSTIMITHDLGIVAETCDEVAVMYAGQIVEKGTLEDVFENTKHPYTEGLFNSLPNMNDRNSKLNPIKGLIPDPTIVFTGCPFAERCRYAKEKCFKQKPTVKHLSESHQVKCLRYDEADFKIERSLK
ncbi:MAG TPA: ABC transporter ATP-binding protein [Erysipelotrichaceae bacterium]|jgi:peptide/nickel transport system ATP-binding protein|nr:ABC transporter ATP-binding protein [Erysipelotrichia bacterium]HPX32677.1 ABC transporter ATP-binding protein [Erysipelotrichaceae bacterium]HQA85356.1 ABC transporter ATP-binding protein [Erysipelotrichaceae bacterium]